MGPTSLLFGKIEILWQIKFIEIVLIILNFNKRTNKSYWPVTTNYNTRFWFHK